MATIANLAIMLGVNPAGVTTGLAAAQKKLQSFAEGVGSTAVAIGAPVAAIGGSLIAAGTALVDFVKSELQGVAATGRLAQRLGLTVEALSGLHYAADRAGVGAEALDAAVTIFTRKLGALRAGAVDAGDALGLMTDEAGGLEVTGNVAKSFERLGLSAEAVARMDTGSALAAVSDALNRIPSAADRARAAYELFGRGGARALNVLTQGSAALNQQIGEARKLGVGLTGEDVARAVTALQAFHEIDAAVAGIKTQLAIGLAPLLTAVAQGLGDFIKSGEGLAPKLGAAIEEVTLKIAVMVDALGNLQAGLEKVGTVARIMGGEQWLLLWRSMSGPEQESALNRTKAVFDQLKKVYDDLAAKARAAAGGPAGDPFADALDKQREKAAALVRADIASPLDKFNARMAELSQLSAVGKLTLDEFALAAYKAGDALESADRSAEKLAGAKLPKAFEMGTAEAISEMYRAQAEAGAQAARPEKGSPAELQKALEKAAETQKQHLQVGKEILKAIKEGKLKVMAPP